MTDNTKYINYTLCGIYNLFQDTMSKEIDRTYGSLDGCDYIRLMTPEDYTKYNWQASLEDFMLKGSQEQINGFLNYYRELLNGEDQGIEYYIVH